MVNPSWQEIANCYPSPIPGTAHHEPCGRTVFDRRSHHVRTSEGTRAAILEAVKQVFALRGFVGASMRDITDAPGISKPVIYYRYGSKQRLYAAIKHCLITDCARQGVKVDRGDERPADPRAELRGLFEAFRDSEDLLRICAWSRLEEGSTGGPAKLGLMKALGRRLELAQQQRVIRSDIDPGNLSIMLVGLVAFWLEGHSNAVGLVEGGPDEPAYLSQAIAMVERGLSPCY
jgi:AcrR family transcriptional regulator